MIVVLLPLLLLVGLCMKEAWAVSVGGTAATFLEIGPGARATAMGDAFVGLADDVTAIYWNPAGLQNLSQKEVSFMHDMWFQSITYDYAALAWPFKGFGVIGMNVVLLNTGSPITQTTVNSSFSPGSSSFFVDSTSSVTASDMLISFSYARALDSQEDWKIGGTFKMISQTLAGTSASAFACDVGLLVRSAVEGLSLGLVFQNLGTQITMQQEGYSLPTSAKAGTSWKIPSQNVTFVMDATQSIYNQTRLNGGLEYDTKRFMDIILRGGYRLELGGGDVDVVSGLTAGFGINLFGMQTDYAFEPFGELGNTHSVSLTYKW